MLIIFFLLIFFINYFFSPIHAFNGSFYLKATLCDRRAVLYTPWSALNLVQTQQARKFCRGSGVGEFTLVGKHEKWFVCKLRLREQFSKFLK